LSAGFTFISGRLVSSESCADFASHFAPAYLLKTFITASAIVQGEDSGFPDRCDYSSPSVAQVDNIWDALTFHSFSQFS